MRNAGNVPPASLVSASRAMVLKWKAALGREYLPLSGLDAGVMVPQIEHAHRSFTAVTRNLPISGWVSRACAKYQTSHLLLRIPTLVAKEGDPLTTRPCPPIYYYEQLLEDLKHIVTHLFEPTRRTIPTPIQDTPVSPPARKSRSVPTGGSSSAVASTGHNTRLSRKKAGSKNRTASADEHFRELAKDIHERNKNIANLYEHHDAE